VKISQKGEMFQMSSGQAIVKPEDLRKFASQLKAFNEQLDANAKQLQSQFKSLGSTWRDQEHRRFTQEFEQTMKVIKRFNEISEQHIPFLLKKAQKADDYLRQR
jgi:uncharacterized protein YukE